MGAINKPIIGNTNATMGASPQFSIVVACIFCAYGIASKTSATAPSKQKIITASQSIFLNTIPAIKRPTAVEAARILAI